MRGGNVMVRADDAALEDREITPGHIIPEVRANIFLCAMVDGVVTCKFVADFSIGRSLIRHDVGCAVNVSDHRIAERPGADVGDVTGADLTAALHQ